MRIGSGHGAARGSYRRHALLLHRLTCETTRFSHKVWGMNTKEEIEGEVLSDISDPSSTVWKDGSL